jgi:predicted metal-dependent phosphoesterase TrpH
MASKLRVEFHCHTIYSKDSLTQIPNLIAAARGRKIDRLVITDHNTIAGAMEAKKLAPDLIVVGEEIMTEEGELLAAFVKEEIPQGLHAVEAIRRLKDQEAFISVSHPFDRLRGGGWSIPVLENILDQIDAIEVFNARCFPPYFNSRATAFANRHNILGTVGSDAHSVYELGRATMLMPVFEDAGGFRQALPQAEFEVHRSSLLVRLISRYAVMRKKIG